MATYRFEHLLRALKEAVISASRVLQDEHIRSLNRYFQADKDGVLEPRTVKIRLPANFIQEGEPVEQIHEVPLLSLVPTRQLGIEELTFEFECALEGVETDDGSGALAVVLNSTPRRLGKHFPAKVTITISGTEPPEGVAKINDHLLKRF